MGKIALSRIIRALDRLDQTELAELQKHLDERLQMGSQALAAGLPAGWYNENQVFKMLEMQRKARDQVWIESIKDLRPLIPCMIGLELYIKEVDQAASLWEGDQLRKVVTISTGANITALIAELAMIVNSMGAQAYGELIERATIRANGINALHSNNAQGDDGRSLRDAVKQERTVASLIAQWRDNLRKTGPTKPTTWRTMLCDMWLARERECPDETPGKVRQAILNEIADWNKSSARYQLKPELQDSGDHKKMLNSLLSTTATKKTTAYRYDLIADLSEKFNFSERSAIYLAENEDN